MDGENDSCCQQSGDESQRKQCVPKDEVLDWVRGPQRSAWPATHSSVTDTQFGNMVDDSDDAKSPFDDLKPSPLSVDHIEIPRALKTNQEKVLQELKVVGEAETLDEVLKLTEEALANLDELGVFRAIDVELAPSPTVRVDQAGPFGNALAR